MAAVGCLQHEHWAGEKLANAAHQIVIEGPRYRVEAGAQPVQGDRYLMRRVARGPYMLLVCAGCSEE
jgi:hypothetical protein